MGEEDVPTEQPEAEEEARIPPPDADARRTRGRRSATGQGPRQPLGLTWRVRDRASFRQLARGQRRRLGSLEMRTAVVGQPSEPPRVAYAVSRAVGSAVTRNRVRRRLRAAVHESRPLLEDGRGYLWRALPGAANETSTELKHTVRALLAQFSGGSS